MGKCLSRSKRVQEGPVNLCHFELLRSVGRGAFGKVRIVRKKSDKALYALKYINKEKCIQQKALRNTIFERNLLADIEHVLIVNLRYAFQDQENMFMVLDLMLGGDLKYHLHQSGSFPEDVVRFYAAEMTCALEYLHRRGIIHRDLKPENLLLDAEGHVHLTDFNVATYLPSDGSPLRSISGTIAYMAPEVIQRTGYRQEVDWWSMGVVLYELLFGKRPFRGRNSKEVAIQIARAHLQFPVSSREISQECYGFIALLLRKSPTERLGHGEDGVRHIKQHPFLASIDWDLLERKKLPPIFVPDAERANFNALFEAEDVLMEDKPLKQRRQSKMKEPQSEEERFIRMNFEDFDFQERDKSQNMAQRAGVGESHTIQSGKDEEIEEHADDGGLLSQEHSVDSDLDQDNEDNHNPEAHEKV